MATGADKGLLEEKARAQSTYKHAIIKQYLPRFIRITGSKSTQVALVDGYAGSGRHGTGPGSSTLMLAAAEAAQAIATTSVYLVESDAARFTQLDTIAATFVAKGIAVETSRGQIERELPRILRVTSGDSLFLLLDPCGALLGFDNLVSALTASRPRNWPPTDIVLNFSANLSRRTSGQLLSRSSDQHSVVRLDQVVGGTWWHEIARQLDPRDSEGTFEVAAEKIAVEYGDRIAQALGMKPLVVPIRKKEHLQPLYHLVFLTRSPLGLAQFADAVARARPDWLTATYAGEPDLFEASGEESLGRQTARTRTKDEKESSIVEIRRNIEAIIQGRREFRPLDHVQATYGDQLGIATDTQVGGALRSLVTQGVLTETLSSRHPMQRQFRVNASD
jgi:three-Cys-motif partner protein